MAKVVRITLKITAWIPDWPHTLFRFLCTGFCILTRSTLVQRLWWRLCIQLRSTRSLLWRVTVWSSSPSTSEPTTHSCYSLRLLSRTSTVVHTWHLSCLANNFQWTVGLPPWMSLYRNDKIHTYLVILRSVFMHSETFGFNVLMFWVICLCKF